VCVLEKLARGQHIHRCFGTTSLLTYNLLQLHSGKQKVPVQQQKLRPTSVYLLWGESFFSQTVHTCVVFAGVRCCLCRVTQTRAFDTEPASSSYASGFIVDRARGIILTNRHVVTPGGLQWGSQQQQQL
jgi:S1-C subfamily serine protease